MMPGASQPHRQPLRAHGLVEDGEHHHAVVFDYVEDRVRELPQDSTPDRVLYDRVGPRVLPDQHQRALDRIDEPTSEARFLALIPALGSLAGQPLLGFVPTHHRVGIRSMVEQPAPQLGALLIGDGRLDPSVEKRVPERPDEVESFTRIEL